MSERNDETAFERKIADGGYDTVRLLGRGAFSQVFLVRERAAGTDTRPLACKVSDRTALTLREAALLKEIDHPLFPEFRGMWQDGGTVLLLMEYVCGSSLEAMLRRRGAFSQLQTARVGVELAEGIRYLHQLREPVLFRDIKPANIVIRQDGRVKLLDLGCACGRSEQGRAQAGTPGYAAPEQLEAGRMLTPACDVYGLGKTLEAMAGRNCRGELGRVIRACTRQHPRQRLPDMQSVLAELSLLCEKEKAGTGSVRRAGFLRSPASCIKNVWESGYKNF